MAEVLVAMSVPFVLASAYRSLDLAQSPVLANARNLGKPTPAAELLASMQAFRASTAA
jgi:hypothetical protein